MTDAKTIYLAGGIQNRTVEEYRDWRYAAICKLTNPRIGFEVFDPAQYADADVGGDHTEYGRDPQFYTRLNFAHLRRCSAVLVGEDRSGLAASQGTIAEIGFAYALHIPVIATRAADYVFHNHMLSEMVEMILPDIDGACRAIFDLLVPDARLWRPDPHGKVSMTNPPPIPRRTAS